MQGGLCITLKRGPIYMHGDMHDPPVKGRDIQIGCGDTLDSP